MSVTPEPKPVCLGDVTGQVKITFTWSNDRFEHEVRNGHIQLKSIAGEREAPWPDSPPLQQLSLETIDGRDVILGVGCAGTSHWSVSVEPIDGGFVFDWACQVKTPPEWLGTSYQADTFPEFRCTSGTTREQNSNIVRIRPDRAFEDVTTYQWRYECVFPGPA